MRLIVLICMLSSFQLFGASAVKPKKIETPKIETPKIELDDSKLEKNISNKPAFSRSSSDQAEIDVFLDKKQEEFDEQLYKHMESFENCRKEKSIEDIQKCNKEAVKIKKE